MVCRLASPCGRGLKDTDKLVAYTMSYTAIHDATQDLDLSASIMYYLSLNAH